MYHLDLFITFLRLYGYFRRALCLLIFIGIYITVCCITIPLCDERINVIIHGTLLAYSS